APVAVERTGAVGDAAEGGHDVDFSALGMHIQADMAEPIDRDDPITESHRATAVSRELIERAMITAERAARCIEDARNVLQALWPEREVLRRRQADPSGSNAD